MHQVGVTDSAQRPEGGFHDVGPGQPFAHQEFFTARSACNAALTRSAEARRLDPVERLDGSQEEFLDDGSWTYFPVASAHLTN